MGKTTSRSPPSSVRKWAVRSSRAIPAAMKARSSMHAYRTPAATRSGAIWGSQTRWVSHRPWGRTPNRRSRRSERAATWAIRSAEGMAARTGS
jgi:hypothetical protein